MKKLLLLPLIALLFIACGDDDDNEIEVPDLFNQKELLVEGSPWTFTSMEINNITFNGPEFTIQEATTYINDALQNTMWDFNTNGTGSLTTSDGEGLSFEYEFIDSMGSINFDTIILTVAGKQVGLLESVDVSETELSYNTAEECFGEIPIGDVCVSGTYTFN